MLTEATKAFMDVLAAQERLALAEDIVRLAEQGVHATVERIKAGKVPPVEATKARGEAANARLQVEHARSALEAARKRLAASWGSTRPLFTEAHGTIASGIAPVPPPEELTKRLVQNPDLTRWAIEMEATMINPTRNLRSTSQPLQSWESHRAPSETEAPFQLIDAEPAIAAFAL